MSAFSILRKLRRILLSDRLWHYSVLPIVIGAKRSFHTFLSDIHFIGLSRWLRLIRDQNRTGNVKSIYLPGYKFPLFYRPGTSDPKVILQVFARKEYDCVGCESNVKTVLDCGANIGCTSFYLLHRYPDARVVAVEPDPDNMALCRRNLEPFGERVIYAEAGVWSVACPMVVIRGEYRDKLPWSFQVREACLGEQAAFTALTVPDLISMTGAETVDILKLDIEAAEAEVFRQANWIKYIRTVVIELHGPECKHVVDNALQGFSYEIDNQGELTVYRNIH